MNLTNSVTRETIASYIRAKDENRPHLMSRAFADAATLRMIVNTEAISFPPLVHGREAITDVLVRRFNQTYENIRTFCLSSPPAFQRTAFSCAWLVGMSSKEDRVVRVGCGRYDWTFRAERPHLVEELTIAIDVMQLLPADTLASVVDWLEPLPHPWCSKQTLADRAPRLESLAPIRQWLSRDG